MTFAHIVKHAVIVFFLLGIQIASANSKLEIITVEYPPYSYQYKDTVKGINTEIVKEVFDRLDVEIDIKIMPWSRGIELLKAGKVDGVYNPYKLQDRLEWLDYPEEPLITEKIVFVTQKDAYPKYQGGVLSFENKTVGMLRSFAAGDELTRAFDNGTIKRVDSDSIHSLLKMVKYNRVNAAAIDLNVGKKVALQINQTNDLDFMLPPFQEFRTYLAFAKKRHHVDMISKVDRVLREMREEGFIEKATNKYVGFKPKS